MTSRKTRARQHREHNEALRPLRKHLKRHRKPGPVRGRVRVRAGLQDTEAYLEMGASAPERVMPRGERERRRQTYSALAALAGEDEDEGPMAAVLEQGDPGVVVEVASSLCRVDVGGRSVLCSLRGGLSAHDTGLTNVVAVGDDVTVALEGAGQGVVQAVLPRRSALVRPDVFRGHLQQVIAANVDQLLVVASWREPALWFELIDRYLIAAERNRLAALICVNKVDLAADRAECRAALGPYLSLGYEVLFASARSGEGIGELRAALHGRTTVLAGLSGVGKSSLLEAVQPGLRLRTAEVSDHWHLGRHTTTQVSLIACPGLGARIVDTPGIREFGLSGLRRRDLVRFYPEIGAVAAGCRFADCSHTHEPGCAVIAAVGDGRIPGVRYESYGKIWQGLPA